MNAANKPYVGVIHATPLSMEPLGRALAQELPDARVRNLLDDSLLADLQAAGALTPELGARMDRLLEHLLRDHVDVIQLACSGFGPVVDAARARLPVPLLKPDEAMYQELVDAGHAHVGIAATVAPAADLASRLLADLAAAHGLQMRVTIASRPEGMAAAQRGDAEGLRAAVVAAGEELAEAGVDAIALAQYSISMLDGAVAEATGRPVSSGPMAAARRLRAILGGQQAT